MKPEADNGSGLSPPGAPALLMLGVALVLVGLLLVRWWRAGERPEGDPRWPILIATVIAAGVACLVLGVGQGLGLTTASV